MYAIVENDAGLVVVEFDAETAVEDAALRAGGVVVDAGPYKTFEDAYDSMLELKREEDEEAAD